MAKLLNYVRGKKIKKEPKKPPAGLGMTAICPTLRTIDSTELDK